MDPNILGSTAVGISCAVTNTNPFLEINVGMIVNRGGVPWTETINF